MFKVSACGWDSIPADLGTRFTQYSFPPHAVCSSVASYLSLSSSHPDGFSIHFPTYAAAVAGFGDVENLRRIRASAPAPPESRRKPLGRRPPRKGTFHFAPDVDKWCMPFMGSDASVVRQSQIELGVDGDRSIEPVHYEAWMILPSR